MTSQLPLSPKQLEFVANSKAKWNLAHGPVRSGKTVGTVFAFLHDVDQCPDSQIMMIGHTSGTIFRNVISLIIDQRPPGIPDPLALFRPFCTWNKGERKLLFKDKRISTVGVGDAGSIGVIQGSTLSLVYCDEMTLYGEPIIDMIDTRLSNTYSRGYAAMNPSHPNHKLKKWIDEAEKGNPDYYAMQIMLEDNPYLEDSYKNRIKNSLSGIFYKRNYLGLWCLAEGAVFDFFERNIHVVKRPPRAAEYFIAGIDYGTVNSFACTLIGINTGHATQSGPMKWAEAEYVWDSKKKGRQKTNHEYAVDTAKFLEPYGPRAVYVDPSAAAFKLELRRLGLHVVDAENDVTNGIAYMSSEMQQGNLFICESCPNLIREIESYVWDPKQAERGYDEPLKKDDHSVDSLRYPVYTHKVSAYNPYSQSHNPTEYLKNRFESKGSFR